MNKAAKISVLMFLFANISWYVAFYKPISEQENRYENDIQMIKKNSAGGLDAMIKKTLHLRDSLQNEIERKKNKTEEIGDIGRIERQFKQFCRRYGVVCNGFKPQYEMFYKTQQEKQNDEFLPLFVLTTLDGKFESIVKLIEHIDNFESLIYPSFHLEGEQTSGKENKVSIQIMLSLIVRNQ